MGLAHCFLKNEEGRLEDALRVEPINSSSLECMHVGAPTSFKAVTALTLGELHDLTIADLPEEFAGAELCEDFAARGQAAARTWTRTHAQEALMDIVPLGALKTDFNFCPEDRPRVVNAIRVVTVRAVSASAPAAEVAPQRPAAPPASPRPRSRTCVALERKRLTPARRTRTTSSRTRASTCTTASTRTATRRRRRRVREGGKAPSSIFSSVGRFRSLAPGSYCSGAASRVTFLGTIHHQNPSM